MGDVLNEPFRSEAYDRLMEAQSTAPEKVSLVSEETYKTVIRACTTMLDTPITAEGMRNARTAFSLSQQALAEAIGTNAPNISNMENGKAPIDSRTDLAIRALLARRMLA